MKITLSTVTKSALPAGRVFMVLDRGPDAYCNLRAGNSLDLVVDDGTVTGTVVGVSVGPLCNHFNPAQLGQPAHYAVVPQPNGMPGDVRDMVDALEKQFPKDAKAIDPRTIYSAVQVQLPLPSPTFV